MSETDAFAAVTNLIALVADPKAAGQRMTALEKQLEAVARARPPAEGPPAPGPHALGLFCVRAVRLVRFHWRVPGI
jgi:hypothetical protein